MKRILVLILILTFVGTSLLAKTEIKVKKEPLRNDVSPTINHTTIIGTDDPGDILLDYDVQTPTATICPGEDNQLLGCEFDGTYIWVTGGGGTVAAMPNQLYKYDSDGNILAFYPQGTSSAWGMRDMAFDGTYLYAGDDNGFYQIDPVDGSVTTLFTGNLGLSCIRALAYSPSTGYFYACNWNTHIVIFDATGTQQGTLTNPGNGDNYGMAYDEFDTTGDYLWLFSQQGTPATTFYQYDMNTQALTGVTYVVPYLTGAIDQMAGGACFTTNLVPGKCVLGGITQGDPVDRFFAMELADAADPAAPGPPTDVVVTPDAGGALEAQIDWICPTLQVNGDPLTELLEMRVYRDDVLIYTDTAPVIGGPGSYTDSAVLASGTYSYKVVGYNSFDEGIPVTVTVWVGEDVPDAVTDLTLTDVSTDDLMAQLDWVNPTTGLHGGYFPGVTGYDIERSDGATFTIGGPVTLWIDDTIVDPGIYWYAVTPFNNSGSGPSTQTPSVGIGISVIEVGNAEITDYQIPMNLYWHNTIVETVYDKEWIGEGMIINAIAFHAASITNTINPFNFEIWLGEIDIDDLSGGWIDASQLTMVFDGTIDVPTGEYWLEIPLDTPFIYENNDNLVMGIIKDDDQYYSPSGSDVWWTTESGTANRTLHEYSDSEEFSIQNPPADLNPKTTYADVRFYYSGIADPLAPGEPTDVTFIPDAGGALECDISWTC
ncbi:MAG: hypothetical protein KAU01_02965, partial [Candidatus Cloacimonetes bacterium]|nr:hypothetical protein [Candidatus Cloacimonadota bacterium]